MNNNNITISLFRVSADSKYLDMIFDCPDAYHFDTLTLQVKYLENNIMRTDNFDLSAALFNTDEESETCTNSKKHWVVRLPLEKINISLPAIYSARLRATNENSAQQCLEDWMICSDVNLAYKCMLNDLLAINNLTDSCVTISDEAIRKYLLLYGHQAAMSTGDEEAAERFFKLIVNCFDICGKGCGCCAPKPKSINSCNCGK